MTVDAVQGYLRLLRLDTGAHRFAVTGADNNPFKRLRGGRENRK